MDGTNLRGKIRWLMLKRERIMKALFDLVVPSRCFSCDRLIANQGALCAACWREMAFISEPLCSQTGNPFSYEQAASCLGDGPVPPTQLYRQLRAASQYSGTAQKLVLALKFHDRTELAAPLARLMVLSGSSLLRHADLIIPVPLHKSRLKRRRFNQAALIARQISQLSGVPCAMQALERCRATDQQTQLDRNERRKNVEDAFRISSVHASQLQKKHILLIDDVVTTGETVNACTQALLSQNVANVDVLAFAKVVDEEAIPI